MVPLSSSLLPLVFLGPSFHLEGEIQLPDCAQPSLIGSACVRSCAGACACVRVDVRATEQAGLQTHSLPAGRAVGTESCAAVLINDLKPR